MVRDKTTYLFGFAYKAAIFVVMIMMFFLKGGYYYTETARSISIIFICGALVSVENTMHSGIKYKLNSSFDVFRQNRSLVMIMLLMGGLVCAYSISLIHAYNFEATLHEIIKYASLMIFTYIIASVFRTHGEKKTLLLIIYAIGGLGAVCALSAISNGHVVGWLNSFARLFLNIPTALVALVDGFFVEGFMQYANAYASYLGACFFIGLFLIMNEKRQFIKAIYLFIQVLLCLVFIFTKSRGANLIWAGVCVIAIIVAKNHRRRLIYYFALIAANVALVYYAANITAFYGSGIKSTNLWLWLSFSAVFIMTLSYRCLPKYLKKWSSKIKHRRKMTRKQLIITSVVVLASGALLLIAILRKTSLILDDMETYNRLLYARASYEIFIDHYQIGAGGNAWQILYTNYLSMEGLIPTRFTHSYFLQLAIECGAIGIAIFAGMAFTQIKLFIKSLRVYRSGEDSGSILLFLAGGGLFVHAIIDFDFTYYYILLLWIVLMLFGSSTYSKQSQYSFNL